MDLHESLARAPFFLDAGSIAWVQRTCEQLTPRQKLQQLFVLLQNIDDPESAVQRMQHQPGGVHRKWGADIESAWRTTRAVLEHAHVPPFITGDQEGGGYGAPCATPLPNAMGTAAMADPALAADVARVLAAESRSMGFNWSFTPVADIAHRPDSAIVGTRSYGSNLSTIAEQSLIHLKALQAAGIAATAKHWPGEGFDRRDQHLVTTVNPLSWDDWMASFGRVYRQLIAADVMSVMVGHIAWPAGAQRLNPDCGRSAWQPATVSHELNTLLLRREFGFNGLIVSDATSMGGFGSWAARARMVPALVASGCDVLLFSRHPEQDLACLEAAVAAGTLSLARVEEAVTRVLALKAALGLHRMSLDQRLAPLEEVRRALATPAYQQVAERAAAASVTLVKNIDVLPLSLPRHRRVVVASTGIETQQQAGPASPLNELLDGLRARGFELRHYDAEHPPTPADTDLVLYLLAKESMMCHSHIEVEWGRLHGGPRQGMQRCWHDLPTVMVSFGHPAYLLDAPRVPAYINAYSAGAPQQRAVLRKLLGEEPFTGSSPIDPFCGQEEARW